MANLTIRANHELAPTVAHMIKEVIEKAREMTRIILGVVDDGVEALPPKTRMYFRFRNSLNMNLDANNSAYSYEAAS